MFKLNHLAWWFLCIGLWFYDQGIRWCHSFSPVTLTSQGYDLCKVTVASVLLLSTTTRISSSFILFFIWLWFLEISLAVASFCWPKWLRLLEDLWGIYMYMLMQNIICHCKHCITEHLSWPWPPEVSSCHWPSSCTAIPTSCTAYSARGKIYNSPPSKPGWSRTKLVW